MNQLDHQIGIQNGLTSVLEFSPQRLQVAKLSPAPDLATRIEELTREAGQLRYEIQFYRQCFEILQQLRTKSYEVYQQIFLAHYLDHDADRLNEIMTELHRALEQSVRLEAAAKRTWMYFWGIDLKADETGSGAADQDEQLHGNWI